MQACGAAFAQDGFSGTYQSQQPAQWQPLAPQEGYGQVGLSDWQRPGQSGQQNEMPQQQMQGGQGQYYGYASNGQPNQMQGYQGQAGYQSAPQNYQTSAQMPIQQGNAGTYQGPYAPQQGFVTQAEPPPNPQPQKPKNNHSGLKKAAAIAAGAAAGVGAILLINRALTPQMPYYPYNLRMNPYSYYPAYNPYVYNPLGNLLRL